MKRYGYVKLAMILMLFSTVCFAGNPEKSKATRIQSVTTNDVYATMLVNNIFNFYSNTGDASYSPFTMNSGFEFPKGSGKTAVFEEGMVWGGYHKGFGGPKVGGSTYWHALQAGPILQPGGAAEEQRAIADDPSFDKYRVYRVRPDVTPQNLSRTCRLFLTRKLRYSTDLRQ